MLKRVLTAQLYRQVFDPTLLGVLINPFFLARRGLAWAMRNSADQVRGCVLDVGCGQKPYMAMFRATEYIGVEIDTPDSRRRNVADRFYGGRHMPFTDGEFDTVLCNQVLQRDVEGRVSGGRSGATPREAFHA